MDNKKKKAQTIMDIEDLEDSEEDDDYVPDAKQAQETEKELAKQNGVALPSDKKKSEAEQKIEALKEKKRQKETDDLWDLMNMEEEDQFYKSKLKRFKKSEDDEQPVKKEVNKETKEASAEK